MQEMRIREVADWPRIIEMVILELGLETPSFFCALI